MVDGRNEQKKTYDDLGDDAGLAEREGEAPGEHEDEADLQDDERQREVQRGLSPCHTPSDVAFIGAHSAASSPPPALPMARSRVLLFIIQSR